MVRINKDLTIVLPTKNEEENILLLLSELKKYQPYSILVVDDSDDSTKEKVLNQDIFPKETVRLVHRVKKDRKAGLSGAVINARDLISTPYFAIMDADLQHPPEALLRLSAELSNDNNLDIISASRFLPGSTILGLSQMRRLLSLILIIFTKKSNQIKLLNVTDPLTGLFLARTELLNNPNIKPDGFKLLLEIILAHPYPLTVKEIPFTFHDRKLGNSKANIKELFSLVKISLRSR